MEKIRIFKLSEAESRPLPAQKENAGWVKRVIYPPHFITNNGTFFGVGEVNPGFSPHRWHNHDRDKAEGYSVEYPKNFEEIYYIVSGTGVMQWKTPDGKVKEEKVGPGDTIYMPGDAPQHQLLNNGTEKITLIFCGSPTAKVTFSK